MVAMANIKISLGTDKDINRKNIYSDVDIGSKYLENTLRDRKSIENSITNLLSWKPRQRIMRPDLGNSLWGRVFDNFSNFTPSDIKSEVRRILSYEDRIMIKEINVETNLDNSELYIGFTYTIPSLDKNDKSYANSYSLTITTK